LSRTCSFRRSYFHLRRSSCIADREHYRFHSRCARLRLRRRPRIRQRSSVLAPPRQAHQAPIGTSTPHARRPTSQERPGSTTAIRAYVWPRRSGKNGSLTHTIWNQSRCTAPTTQGAASAFAHNGVPAWLPGAPRTAGETRPIALAGGAVVLRGPALEMGIWSRAELSRTDRRSVGDSTRTPRSRHLLQSCPQWSPLRG